jgi:hypothetical protein
MYLYICGSMGGRSGPKVPFGAKLWEAVSLSTARNPAKKSCVCSYLIGLLIESLNQNTNICAIRV